MVLSSRLIGRVATILLFFTVAFSFTLVAFAASNIDVENTGNHYAQFLNTDYGSINFKPTNGDDVIVTKTGITGDAWGENTGWITFDPPGGGVSQSPEDSGNLSGYAWGENTGWINFNPTNASVSIDDDGYFSGHAWSENYGWIEFDCTTKDVGSSGACVRTDWQQGGTIVGGGGSGPGGDDDDDDDCPPGYTCTPVDGDDDDDEETVADVACNDGIDNDGDGAIDYPADSGCASSVDDSEVGEVIVGGGGSGSGDDSNGDLDQTDDDSSSDDIDADDSSDDETTDDSDDSDDTGDIEPDGGFGGVDASTTCTGMLGSVLCDIEAGIDLSIVTVGNSFDDIAEIVRSPEGNAISKIISTVGIVSSLVATLGSVLFLNPLSVSELVLIPVRLWSLLLSALGMRKRRRQWGTVYDSITKQPLDPAYVVLQDMNGEEVETSITDLDGRYGFLVEKGTYQIVAHKTHYTFPSKKLVGRERDELYDDLYFGDPITITEDGGVFKENIPMDPEDFDWNEFAKREQKLMKFHTKRNVWLARFSDALYWFGFVVSVIALLVTPDVYNIIIFALYIVMFFLRKYGLNRKPSGRIMDSVTGTPFSFSIVRVYSAHSDQEIIHKVADKDGRFYLLISPGRYYVTIEKKVGEDDYELIYTSKPKDYTKGYIDTDFEV